MPLDQIDVDTYEDSQQQEMSFLEHLEELRWHLVRSAASIIIFGVLAFIAGKTFFQWVVFSPKEEGFITYRAICALSESLCFNPPNLEVIAVALGEQFIVHFKFCIMIGIVLGFPYIFWEVWRFIRPGLYPKEQKAARGIVLICSLLFISGVAFGYFIVAPFAISFLANYDMGAQSTVSLSSYVNYMTMFTLPTGFVYELPIVVYFLSKVGLITPEFMKTYRRHAFIVILILAAIITPPDVITQLLIGFPLYILYEISIIISARVARKREEDLA